MNGYELSRKWFNWCFENPDKVSPNHTALYFFCIEHCNRLGWKEKFGLPTTMAKEAIGIRSYNTYINTFNDLIVWGFINLIEKSKNQYSSNIIALSNFDNAYNNALDKALINHTTKQCESTEQSIDSIIKQLTINKEQITRKHLSDLDKFIKSFDEKFSFKKSLLNLGVEEQIASDWMQVRKAKKAANTETAFNAIKNQIDISNIPANDCIKIAVERSWQGFKAEWLHENKNTYAKTEYSAKQGRIDPNDQTIFRGLKESDN